MDSTGGIDVRSGASGRSRRPVTRPMGGAGTVVTTADVLRELGIEPATSLADAQARLRHDEVAYLPVALLAPGLGRLLAGPTRDLRPTIAQSLARLVDPFAGAGYRVIGAASADDLAAMREFLLASRTDALLFLGTEGEPYADPRRQTRLEHVAAGVVTSCADVEGEASRGSPRCRRRSMLPRPRHGSRTCSRAPSPSRCRCHAARLLPCRCAPAWRSSLRDRASRQLGERGDVSTPPRRPGARTSARSPARSSGRTR